MPLLGITTPKISNPSIKPSVCEQIAQALHFAAGKVVETETSKNVAPRHAHKGNGVDSGSGLLWRGDDYIVELYSRSSPTEIEYYVEHKGKTTRVSHSPPRNHSMLRNRAMLASHLHRLANCAAGAVSIEEPKGKAVLDRFDNLCQALCAYAAANHPGYVSTADIQAPSPFILKEIALESFGGPPLIPSPAFRQILKNRLPSLIMISPTDDDFVGYHLSPARCYFNPSNLSAIDIIRQLADLPNTGKPMLIPQKTPSR